MANDHGVGPSRTHAEQRDVSHFADGEATWMSGDDAHASLEHAIAASVHAAGFDGIERAALSHMRLQVESAMQSLLYHTAELAAVGRQRKPSLRDLFLALIYAGPRLHPAELLAHLADLKDDEDEVGRRRRLQGPSPVSKPTRSELPQWARWCDDWLASEDEEEESNEQVDGARTDAERAEKRRSRSTTWGEKRRKLPPPDMDEIPAHLPALPPSHTWKTSPAFPTKTVSSKDPVAFINAKVSSTRLTEASLRSLIRATDGAAFDGRLKRTRKVTLDSMAEDTKMEDATPPVEDATASPLATNAKPSPSAPDVSERPQRKGRGLSLKLRTSAIPSPGAEAGPEADAAKSTSAVGLRSARILTLPSRRASMQSAGGVAGLAGAGAPSFPFGAPARRDSNIATTPLTPGAGFVYPQTPADFYGRGGADGQPDAPSTAGLEAAGADNAARVGVIDIPGVVNYKRTWYKRNLRPASSSSSAA